MSTNIIIEQIIHDPLYILLEEEGLLEDDLIVEKAPSHLANYLYLVTFITNIPSDSNELRVIERLFKDCLDIVTTYYDICDEYHSEVERNIEERIWMMFPIYHVGGHEEVSLPSSVDK